MHAWFEKVWPAVRASWQFQTTVAIVSTSNTPGHTVYLDARDRQDITRQIFPVRWFEAQQRVVQTLLENQPKADAPIKTRLHWALFTMGAVAEGMFAFNANDWLWSRAFYGEPEWVDPARGIPPVYSAIPAMQFFASFSDTVNKAQAGYRAALPLVAQPLPVRGVPYGNGNYPAPPGPCTLGDLAVMKPYWDFADGGRRGRTADVWTGGATGGDNPMYKRSSMGPLAMGCGTGNVAPGFSLPFINDVVFEYAAYFAYRQWFNEYVSAEQVRFIPWSNNPALNERLYHQELGVVARFTNPQLDHSSRMFMRDQRAMVARAAAYSAQPVTYDLPTSDKALERMFTAALWQKWSVLTFAYRCDTFGRSDPGLSPERAAQVRQNGQDLVAGRRLSFAPGQSWELEPGSPFDPKNRGAFNWPIGLAVIPTLADLERDVGMAFNFAYMTGAYNLWAAWFVQLDFAPMLNAFAHDAFTILAEGERVKPRGMKPFVRAYLAHDDMKAIEKADKFGKWATIMGPTVAALSAALDYFTGNWTATAADIQSGVLQAKKLVESNDDLSLKDVFTEAPSFWLRSGPTSAPEGQTGALTSSGANLGTFIKRMHKALDNALEDVRAMAAAPKAPAHAVRQQAAPASAAPLQKRVVMLPKSAAAWAGWAALSGAAALVTVLAIRRKRGR